MTLLELEDLEEEVVSAPSFCWKIKNIVSWHMKRCLRDAGLTLGGADLTWPDLTCWTAEIKCELDREQGMKKLPNFIFSFSTADWQYMFYICALASNIKHLHQPRKYKVQENPSFYSGQELILYILGTFSHVPSRWSKSRWTQAMVPLSIHTIHPWLFFSI